jgi:hypothetical protein
MNFISNRNVYKTHMYVYMYITILAIIGAQRFYLENLYVYTCIFPLISSVFYYQSDKSKSLVFLIISLFLSVDNGAGEYVETASSIRYIVYLWCLFFIIRGATVKLQNLILYLLLLIPPLLITLYSYEALDIKTLVRDVFIIGAIGVSLIQTKNNVYITYLGKSTLYYFFFIFLLLEVVNIVPYFSEESRHYLSYDSLKGLVTFSLFFLISEKKYIIGFFVGMLTFLVLLMYGTRMVLLMFFLTIALHIVKTAIIKKNIRSILASLSFIVVIIAIISTIDSSTKFGFMLNQIWVANNIKEWMVLIDPVRYYENLMFFDRDILSILFGSGFGSGIYDAEGYLDFVTPTQTAFSLEELNSKMYYNFHDFWVDYGLRFGLFNVFLFLIFVLKKILKNTNNVDINLIFLFLIFTVFYSTSGILLISIFLLLSKEKSCK